MVLSTLGLTFFIKPAPYLIFILCHPSIYMGVTCEVSSDRIGIDHHPFIIATNKFNYPVPESASCITKIFSSVFYDCDDKMAIFSSTLLERATDNIPKTVPFPKREVKPWFDEDYQAPKNQRNKANRLATKSPTGLILGLYPDNERRRHKVTPFLIAHLIFLWPPPGMPWIWG